MDRKALVSCVALGVAALVASSGVSLAQPRTPAQVLIRSGDERRHWSSDCFGAVR